MPSSVSHWTWRRHLPVAKAPMKGLIAEHHLLIPFPAAEKNVLSRGESGWLILYSWQWRKQHAKKCVIYIIFDFQMHKTQYMLYLFVFLKTNFKCKLKLIKMVNKPWLLWLSGLCGPANQMVLGSVPSQGTCLGCGPGPQWGVCKRQTHTYVSLPVFLLLFSSVWK